MSFFYLLKDLLSLAILFVPPFKNLRIYPT